SAANAAACAASAEASTPTTIGFHDIRAPRGRTRWLRRPSWAAVREARLSEARRSVHGVKAPSRPLHDGSRNPPLDCAPTRIRGIAVRSPTRLTPVFAALAAIAARTAPQAALPAGLPPGEVQSRGDPRAALFLAKGCPQCHTISALGVKSP